MTNGEDSKVQNFNARRQDDYSLQRLRAKTALKGKGLWSKLSVDECGQDSKDKASPMLVPPLGTTALCVCSSKIRNGRNAGQ